MEPATYAPNLSIRYYRLEESEFPLDENAHLPNLFGTGLAKKLIKEAYQDLYRRRILKIEK